MGWRRAPLDLAYAANLVRVKGVPRGRNSENLRNTVRCKPRRFAGGSAHADTRMHTCVRSQACVHAQVDVPECVHVCEPVRISCVCTCVCVCVCVCVEGVGPPSSPSVAQGLGRPSPGLWSVTSRLEPTSRGCVPRSGGAPGTRGRCWEDARLQSPEPLTALSAGL